MTLILGGVDKGNDYGLIKEMVEEHHDDKGIIWPFEFAPYKVGIVVINTKDEIQLKKDIAICETSLKKIAGEYIFGYENDELESVVGELLRNKNETISVAESCTGGFLGHKFTSIPGSSDYFMGGVLAYSNEVKMELLGVEVDGKQHDEFNKHFHKNMTDHRSLQSLKHLYY